MLQQNEQNEQAKLQLTQFNQLFDQQDESKNSDPEIMEQAHVLGQLLAM